MPAGSVKPVQVGGKVVFKEHPALARLGRFDAPLAGVEAQHGRGHAQELGRFVQIEGAHGSVLGMAVHPDVVATGFQPRLAVGVGLQPFRNLAGWVVVIGLKGV